MRYHALALDYDGTLARAGRVDAETLAALEAIRASGRKLVLVTGRELEDLLSVFPRSDLFDVLVVENGAVLYQPSSKDVSVLADAPPAVFVQELRARGVAPLSVGRVIVATWQPNDVAVLETIRELGLELQVIFNKGAVMVLPSGVNKATGLRRGLELLGLSPHNAVAVGDGENDHAFLELCECAVAVENALPMLQERADWIAPPNGAGVRELIAALGRSDLRELDARLRHDRLLLGTAQDDGAEIAIGAYSAPLLLAGMSGGGKSTLATGFLEQLAERGYQFCIVDPEGDYQELADAVVLGDANHAPSFEEVLEVLRQPLQNAVVQLIGVPIGDRPAYFEALLPRLLELRARTGRPHWIAIDEAHHLLPGGRPPALLNLPRDPRGLLGITVHPDHVAEPLLGAVELAVVIGGAPQQTLAELAGALGVAVPQLPPGPLPAGEAYAWRPRSGDPPVRFRALEPRGERRRHLRKYASGALGPDKSFYFRGPELRLNLRAQNLHLFAQLARGVDDETWLHHLRRRDYSRWFRDAIKDPDLAQEVEAIEGDPAASACDSRERVLACLDERYTAPA